MCKEEKSDITTFFLFFFFFFRKRPWRDHIIYYTMWYTLGKGIHNHQLPDVWNVNKTRTLFKDYGFSNNATTLSRVIFRRSPPSGRLYIRSHSNLSVNCTRVATFFFFIHNLVFFLLLQYINVYYTVRTYKMYLSNRKGETSCPGLRAHRVNVLCCSSSIIHN